GPAGDHLGGIELALLCLEAGIADQPGGTAHHGDGPVASELEAAQGEQGHEAAYVQAVGGGVEAAIKGARLIQMGGELVVARHLGQKAPRLKIRNQFRALHDPLHPVVKKSANLTVSAIKFKTTPKRPGRPEANEGFLWARLFVIKWRLDQDSNQKPG